MALHQNIEPLHSAKVEAFAQLLKPTADDYFQVLLQLASSNGNAASYSFLYALLQRLCEEHSEDRLFSNLFSRLSYVCRTYQVPTTYASELQNFRRRCHHLGIDDKEVATQYLQDVRLLADFVELLYKRHKPSNLSALLPTLVELGATVAASKFYKFLRVQVKSWDDHYIYAEKDDDAGSVVDEISIDYVTEVYGSNLSYLRDLLTADMSLTLLKTTVQEDGTYLPETIIIYPDYLVDVSTLASCFKEYGHDERNFILARLECHEDTPYTLLGQLASQALDDIINSCAVADSSTTYADTVNRAFRAMPVPFAFVDLNTKFVFHKEGQLQFHNIQRLVANRLEADYGFNLSKALIEPSFICPVLGVSGRMDFLQSDYRKLVEQKSGKMDEFRKTHREVHFIQMMLYRAMLEYSVGVSGSTLDSYLLYSKYTEGLFEERAYQKLLFEVLALRNKIVMQEIKCAAGGIRSILDNLSVEDLRTQVVGKLWTDYQAPKLVTLLSPFTSAKSDFERLKLDYFYRFYTFLCREHVQQKLSTPGNAGRAFSDLWNLPAQMRHDLGSLYWNLKVAEVFDTENEVGGIDRITFEMDCADDGFLSNFRLGDVVIVYRYEGLEPNVCHQFLMRGAISEITPTSISVKLRHPQRNRNIFQTSDGRFAIEHDMMESSSNRLFASLYTFLIGSPERQELFLHQRQPKRSAPRTLHGDYGSFNDLVRTELRAEELFMVIGPPGSGKTNCAIRFMLEEELRRGEGSILLMAYTNRAVDELCGMLQTLHEAHPECLPDYLRIGSELTADASSRAHILSERCKDLKNVNEVRSLLMQTRVFVGTISSVSGQSELLRHKHFVCAFVDEASQILEPQMCQLFFAKQIQDNREQHTIDRFVLIGDQKQLPAVVVQSAKSSEINEPSLQKIGLTDCRRSLFERFLSLQQQAHDSSFYYLLEKQGRMHPDLFQFVNHYFYQNHLACVPLSHQQCSLEQLYPHTLSPAANEMMRMMRSHRVSFLNCLPQNDGANDKINSAEAQLVALCLKQLQELYHNENKTLVAENVGIIVPYRNQIAMIRKAMQRLHLDALDALTIDTVERYQGSQRDIIFYVCTIRQPFQLDFLAAATYCERSDAKHDYLVDRKLNVALTRAREQTFIIGNANLLRRNILYKALINECRQNKGYYDATKFIQNH